MKRRILVVDDNPINRRLATSILELEGYAVEEAASAAEALERLAGAIPVLILMDIAMPGMDGLELTRRLKGDPARRHIPIVALTAFAMKGDEDKARAAGCDGYITKPIDSREFPAQVARYLQRSEGR